MSTGIPGMLSNSTEWEPTTTNTFTVRVAIARQDRRDRDMAAFRAAAAMMTIFKLMTLIEMVPK